jgi:hypothetical protein
LTLSDELRDLQTGIITKGDGYIAPKAEQIPRIMEAIEVKKKVKVKVKARRAPRPSKNKDELLISEETDTTLVPPSKGKQDKPTSKSTAKKVTTQSRTVSILQQSKVDDTLDRPCAYYNSAGGCSLSTCCKYSHRLPTDITEAKQVKYMVDRLHLNGHC